MIRLPRKPAEAEPARLGRLAKLPVFFDLLGRKVVLAGGSDGAAWKAELLASAGARVEVYAAEPGDTMVTLATRGAAGGSLRLHRHTWSCDVFAGAALAIADIEDDAEAIAFRCAARAAGVPVNIVDKPDHCDFQFGSIVNRSPVVIGISTDGAAPILGQAIRRRIEVLLPAGLAGWAALARSIRDRVMTALRPGAERRRFWDAFSELAFRETPPATETALHDLVSNSRISPDMREGRVTLVGAGPGDAELLTLKAVRALQSADVILFDDLVSHDVLELARREAKRMMVGKRGSRESCKQHDINALMLKLAKQGKHVVRLKSGDPMIFGRAGEEIAALEAENITVTVVPGITAAQGMAAALNVSLTHRDHAQTLTLLTGHSRHGSVPEAIDWSKAVDRNTTTILYMAGRTADAIVARLIGNGLAPETPVVAMSAISRPERALWTGSLARLPDAVACLPASAPVLIGIGAVFAKAGHRQDAGIGVENRVVVMPEQPEKRLAG